MTGPLETWARRVVRAAERRRKQLAPRGPSSRATFFRGFDLAARAFVEAARRRDAARPVSVEAIP